MTDILVGGYTKASLQPLEASGAKFSPSPSWHKKDFGSISIAV
jgi:hypothetical protein